ncbi:MAG: hypothetical protein ABW194_07980 [Novosphingobium sp.]
MRVGALLAGAALLAAGSAMVAAQESPESLLPPGFDQPTPTPAPTPRGSAPAPDRGAAAPTAPPAPTVRDDRGPAPPPLPLPGLPSLGDTLDPELLEQLIEAQRPKFDIPPAAARSLAAVGVLAEGEGGLPEADTAGLNGRFLFAVLEGTRGPLVSRWGQILLRRALASRLATPVGLNGADWAALRARVLLRLGEVDAARALVQQVDSGSYTPRLEDAALDAYVATGDLLGICPVVAITAARRDEPQWQLSRQICRSFEGKGGAAMAELERYRRRGLGGDFKNIDILLAQKFAGSALESRKAVRIEWAGVEALTSWRYGLALATGLEPPAELLASSDGRFDPIAARAPMLPLAARAAAADRAASRDILSSAAMVDLYAQLAASDDVPDEWKVRAQQLREAYVAAAAADRLAAMRKLWGSDADAEAGYSRRVLTAYAAARLPVSEAFADAVPNLLASMLAAGLDANAARWSAQAPEGSLGWALLAVGAPGPLSGVSGGALETFAEDGSPEGARRARFLLAGLYGLGRVSRDTATEFARDIGVNLGRGSRWTRAIDAAADSGNQPLVAILAGAGMQGDGWDRMTALHLYHVVSALRRVGLEPEARMIAAEALARA